ncbi:MAG: hypothetical protein IPI46_05480 [Bacteroidetes bacterium]|nr:hypothetical protein [Bacteroidota bacterium]
MARQIYYLKPLVALMVCYLITLLFSGCSDDKQPKKVDVSKIPVKIQSIRWDQALFHCDTNALEKSVNALGNRYPDFASVYFTELTGFAKGNDQSVFFNSVRHFLTYKDYVDLYDTVQKHYPDVKEIDQELAQLFKHIKYYFPNKKLGDVYYFISGLNFWSAVTVDTAVGVGLDMFLGKDYPFYAAVQLPAYQAALCERKYIPVNVSRAIYEDMFPIVPDGKNLLELMLMKGREMLFMEYTLPETSDELLIGYTPEQLAWCKKNEAMIWNYFSTQKLLYSTNWQDILRYVNEGPTSTGMPPEAPGNIGTWLGWQIIRKYVKHYPDKKLPEVWKENPDAQGLIRDIKYRPKG